MRAIRGVGVEKFMRSASSVGGYGKIVRGFLGANEEFLEFGRRVETMRNGMCF